jgi:hypothetical protein
MDRGNPIESGRPRFPALDPEPPPSARRRRVAVRLAAAVVVLAALAGGGYLVGSGHHATTATARKSVSARYLSAAPVARIVSITPKDYLALSNLREGRATLLKSLGQMTSTPVPSLDARYLVSPYGQLISLSGPASLGVSRSRISFNGYQEPAFWAPLADHDLYAVVLDSSQGFGSTDNPISLQALATGRSVNLGVGDNVSGDPARPGVFTSVAAPIHATAQANQSFPDSRVEVRDAGRPRVTLATVAQLDRDLHLPASVQAALLPIADPAGDKIAVAVQPTSAAARPGVVVMTRTGRVIRTFTGLSGVIVPAWSQSGRSLAFVAGGAQAQLYIWTVGSRTNRVRLPVGQYASCVWSPDAAWILCPDEGAAGNGQTWELTSSDGATTVHTSGPGFPIAWLGGK